VRVWTLPYLSTDVVAGFVVSPSPCPRIPWVTVEVESELGPKVDEVKPVEETMDWDIESCSEEYESVWAGTYSVVTALAGLETSGGLKLDKPELPFILRPVRSLPRSRPG
jgi:hypothetical protein